MSNSSHTPPPYRIGFGFDVHQLEPATNIALGGITFPSTLRAVGHSDADVLLHALCDALLGAVGQRDIGFHFPNTDPSFKGIDSKILLAKVIALVHEKGYLVGNVDMTVIAEEPKINPHIPNMIAALAPILQVASDCIAIKATTNETMGFIGRQEGIAAHAVALVYRAG